MNAYALQERLEDIAWDLHYYMAETFAHNHLQIKYEEMKP